MGKRRDNDLPDPRTIPPEALDLEGWRALALELTRRADEARAELTALQAERERIVRERRGRIRIVGTTPPTSRKDLQAEVGEERARTARANARAATFRTIAREDRLAENERRAALGIDPIPLPPFLLDE